MGREVLVIPRRPIALAREGRVASFNFSASISRTTGRQNRLASV